jgi:phosphonate transport system permease protein
VTAWPARRRELRGPIALSIALAASVALLPWNLTAVTSLHGLEAAWSRLREYMLAFAAPDLSAAMLGRCASLAAETLSIAVLGTAIGLFAAYPLALASCRAVVIGDDPMSPAWRVGRRVLLESSRLLLDALRGVPDFLWAILIANFAGVNATTGVIAIAISAAGILGKVLSEQWDNVAPQSYAALRSTGASRLLVFAYAVQPLAARSMQSFLLMRFECAVRNASVIGVVGGGGLGAALWDEYTDGNWSRMATVLLSLLVVTVLTDLGANLVRRQLRVSPGASSNVVPPRDVTARRRRSVAAVVAAVLAWSAWALAGPIARAVEEVQRIEWSFATNFVADLAVPDLSAGTLASVAGHSLVPIALSLTATLLGAAGAALLVFPGSATFQLEAFRFTGERVSRLGRLGRWLSVIATRTVAVVLRAVPEVAWVVLLSVFFQTGITPCVLAVAFHSTGVLHRVFTETLDNLPHDQLERIGIACRPHVFLYGALPRALADWRTYVFFQFEVNVRIGIALGLVGAGGLGDRFDSNLKFSEYSVASTYLWAMILLTVLIDRTSRWMQLRRSRC